MNDEVVGQGEVASPAAPAETPTSTPTSTETSPEAAAAPSAPLVALRAILRALRHPGVDALVLTEGDVVFAERGGKRAPLTQNPLQIDQIEALLAPTAVAAALQAAPMGQTVHTFALDAQHYSVAALRGPAGLRLRLTLVAAPGAEAGQPSPFSPTAAVAPTHSATASQASASAVAADALNHVAAFLPAQAAPAPLPPVAPTVRPEPADALSSAPSDAAASPSAAETFSMPGGRRHLAAAAPAEVSKLPPLRRRQPVRVPVPLAAQELALTAGADGPDAAAAGAVASEVDLTGVSVQQPTSAAAPVAVQHITAPQTQAEVATLFGVVAEASAASCTKSVVAARAAGASDVHFLSDQPPRWRRAGVLAAEGLAVASADLAAFAAQVLPPARAQRFAAEGYADFAFVLPGGGRLRANLSRQASGLKLCLRLVAATPPSLAALGITPAVAAVGRYHQGLAIVAGPQGHGKSTTLAAILDQINAERRSHVVLLEDPIEVEHPKRLALFSQREVGRDTRSFARALKASLREDPDIIVIGELRDRETIEMALSAAETGHLVLTTMNTRSAAKTIDRLIDMFPPGDQPQIRAALAGALKMIVSQRLLPATDGTLVPAVEVVTGSPPLWALIRDNKLAQLPTLQQRGAELGMVLLDQSLAELVQSGRLALPTAQAAAESPAELQRRLTQRSAGQ